MKVVFATSEFEPLVKTGGLADVSGSLPGALARLGVGVRVLLPAYPSVLRAVDSAPIAQIPHAGALPPARLLMARSPQGADLLLIDCPSLYDRPGNPYLDADGKDWPDNDIRFGLLSRTAALLGARGNPLEWRPDVIHCHDWQAALAPVYLRHQPGAQAASVVTIHNLAYQGVYPHGSLARVGLPPSAFTMDGAEYYGQLGFLKGGLACADAITTVSPTYAREICTPVLGFGLQGILSARAGDLTGILNGVDIDYWNPAADRHIAQPYDADHLDNKRLNKRALQGTLGLPVEDATPLLGVVSRLVEQKGIDLVVEVMERIVTTNVQLVVQGMGDRVLEERLVDLAHRYPRKVGVRIAYDEGLAHGIEAGADIFLMPSRFEPCGMNQMYSQRYGTLPIGCRTGGLADSITDCTVQALKSGTASGFTFAPASADALHEALQRALALYRRPAAWRRVQRTAMARDFGWGASAREYVKVYERVCRSKHPLP